MTRPLYVRLDIRLTKLADDASPNILLENEFDGR